MSTVLGAANGSLLNRKRSTEDPGGLTDNSEEEELAEEADSDGQVGNGKTGASNTDTATAAGGDDISPPKRPKPNC